MVREIDRSAHACPDPWTRELLEAFATLRLGGLGPYELLGTAGADDEAVTFRARRAGRRFALKQVVCAAPPGRSPERLRAELEAAAALEHPGIVAPRGLAFEGGAALVSMDWIEGVPLSAWARGDGAPGAADDEPARGLARSCRAPRRALALFLEVCEALAHAHARGVLHRDLKPSNVLVDPSGRARVLDFGLPKCLPFDAARGLGAAWPASGPSATAWYAAPERLRGEAVDGRADVYSLGVLLYELLTGFHPREGRAGESLLHAVLAADPPRASCFDLRLSRDVDSVLHTALARDREHRYRSASELGAEVRRLVAGRPVLAAPPCAWDLHRLILRRT